MKFNLKQRRRMIKDDEEIQGLEKREIIVGYEEWFEGFEKEIREYLTWALTQWHPRAAVEKAKRQMMLDINRAILGE